MLIITNHSTIKSKETVYFHWASINDLCYPCLHCRNLFSFHNIARCSPKPGFQVEIWYTNRRVRLLLEELGTNVLPSSNTIPWNGTEIFRNFGLTCRKVEQNFQYGCSEIRELLLYSNLLPKLCLVKWNVAPLQVENWEMPQRNVTFDYLCLTSMQQQTEDVTKWLFYQARLRTFGQFRQIPKMLVGLRSGENLKLVKVCENALFPFTIVNEWVEGQNMLQLKICKIGEF